LKTPTPIIGLVLVIVCLCGVSEAATWYVGSGGFLRIQEAIDASAPGDTIRIGPGWHSYWTLFEDNRVYAQVTKDNLRFIGAGMNATFVGPTTPQHGYGEAPSGFYAKLSWGVQRVAFEDLAAVNVYSGIRCDGPNLEILRCRFLGSNDGLKASLPSGGTIADCRFENSSFNEDNGIFLVYPSSGVIVTDCTFESQWSGISDGGGGTILVSNCRFDECRTGLSVFLGTNATVRQSEFSCVMGLTMYRATAEVADCIFEEAVFNNLRIRYSSLRGTGNIFGGGGESTIYCQDAVEVNLHNNHIFSTGTPYVSCVQYSNPPLRIHHLENNYWGINDVDAINALIESCPYMQVDIEPLADGPVQTESTTWGAVKSLFR
jgi:hypothetical protein